MKQGVWRDHDLSIRAWVRSTAKYRLSLDPLQGTRQVRVVLEERDEGVAYRCVVDEVRCRELDPLMVEVPACFRPTVRDFLTNLKRTGARRAAAEPTRNGDAGAESESERLQLDAEDFVRGWEHLQGYASAGCGFDNQIDTSQLDAELDSDTDDFFRFPFDAEPLRGLDECRPAPVDVAFRSRQRVSWPRHARSSRVNRDDIDQGVAHGAR